MSFEEMFAQEPIIPVFDYSDILEDIIETTEWESFCEQVDRQEALREQPVVDTTVYDATELPF